MTLGRLYTKKHITVGVVSLILIFLFLAFSITTIFINNGDESSPINNEKGSVLELNGQEFNVEKAVTSEQQRTGLSFRASLEPKKGMLFKFENDDTHGIWMKDMKFPIDILWLDSDFKVVHIEENVDPSTYPQVFESPVPARYVFEINAGEVEQFQISSGQLAEYSD